MALLAENHGKPRGKRKHPSTDLLSIPGVGPSLAQDLRDLGIRQPDDLKNRDPQRLYEELCRVRGAHIDRCVLYVFRCAVYFVSEAAPDPEMLFWWKWKDRQYNEG
ncbi:MAG: pathogenicity locus [Deltaproteobacteria bacterium]|nr:pathogenicity locus [Deltaproteobacteria bacterium]